MIARLLQNSTKALSSVASALVLLLCTLAAPSFAQLNLPRAGINLHGVANYHAQFAFANILKQSGKWRWGTSWWDGETITEEYLDADGYPRAIRTGETGISMRIAAGNNTGNGFVTTGTDPLPGGLYVLRWDGDPNADIQLRTDGTGNPEIDIVSSGPNMKVYRLEQGRRLFMTIYSIPDTTNYPRNMRVWMPEFDVGAATDGAMRDEPASVFNPCFLRNLEPYEVLRFMDWPHTNHSPHRHWQDRPLPSRLSYGPQGVPWEAIVSLCNETSSDMYLCVPHMATDDCIDNLARLVQFGSDGAQPYDSPQADPVWPPLDPGLRVFLEYSNEVWNGIFAQHRWVMDSITYPGTNPGQFSGLKYGKRAGELFDIFTRQMGSGTDRLIRVIACAPWTDCQTGVRRVWAEV